MKETTLCYIEKGNTYLMMLRNKKKQDPNEGKWIGVGGKLNEGESPEECLIREVWEETGIRLMNYEKRGVIYFYSDCWEDEKMYLYTAVYDGTIEKDCDEGTLQWIRKSQIMDLNLWEGDRVFLKKLLEGERDMELALFYKGERLKKVESCKEKTR